MPKGRPDTTTKKTPPFGGALCSQEFITVNTPSPTVTELTGTAPDMLDPGVYDARLDRVEKRDTQYGERLRWVFFVPDETSGEETEISLWSALKTHRSTKAGDLIEALGAQRPAKGETLGIETLVGRWLRLVVAPGEDDFPKVTSFMPARRERVDVPSGATAGAGSHHRDCSSKADPPHRALAGSPASRSPRRAASITVFAVGRGDE
jgi:hypothetical protein